MRRIDYDTEQYQDYVRGRALSEHQMQAWISAFAGLLPDRRPLVGLDIGSGTGRFTPALARAFGPATGVEPSVRMREQAQAPPQHPGVRYLACGAEDLPVPSGSADYALMFLSWHHVLDKPGGVRELTRVLRPGGRLLLRSNFSDHHTPVGVVAGALPPRVRGGRGAVSAAARGHRDVHVGRLARGQLRPGHRAVLGYSR